MLSSVWSRRIATLRTKRQRDRITFGASLIIGIHIWIKFMILALIVFGCYSIAMYIGDTGGVSQSIISFGIEIKNIFISIKEG